MISRVRPGSFEARARYFWPTSPLIRLDLPTLERPAKATSGRSADGMVSIRTAPIMNETGWAKNTRAVSICSSVKSAAPGSMTGGSFGSLGSSLIRSR